MLLRIITGKNYFVASIILLVFTIILVVSVFAVTAFIPDALGMVPYEHQITAVSEFEPWLIETEDYYLYFPRGGTIATLQDTGQTRSVMLLGEELYKENDEKLDISGIFMILSHDLFEELRGDNLFVPVENQEKLEQVVKIGEKQKGIPTIWKNKIPLSFHPRDAGLVYMYYISAEGEPILPPQTTYSERRLAGSATTYFLFTLIVLLIITIFTLDHHNSSYWVHLAKNPPGYLSLVLAPALAALIALIETIPEQGGWPEYYTTIAYYSAILFLVILARLKVIDYLDFGLRLERARYGYLLALLTAVLVMLATRGLPAGITFNGYEPESLQVFLIVFLMMGLPREMLWRGYIQTFLSRRLGSNWGFLLMILMVAATRYYTIYTLEPWMLDYPYTYLEIAILAPGTAAILGYLYLRTENILACALLHSLLLFLPGLIQY